MEKSPFDISLDNYIRRIAEKQRDGHYTYKKMVPPPVQKALMRNEIPLGWADEEQSTELISVKLRDEEKALLENEEANRVLSNMKKFEFLGSSLRLIISSSAEGSGKTVLMGILVLDFLHDWYKVPVWYHDPQWEIHYREKENSNTRDKGVLNTLTDITGQDFSPKGHTDLKIYTPYFLRSGSMKKDGNVYQYNSNNLVLDDLSTIMGSELNDEDVSRLKQYLMQLYKAKGQDVGDIEMETMKLPPIYEIGEFIADEVGATRGSRGVDTDRVVRALRNAVTSKRIGNDAPAPNMIETLEKGGVAVVQTTTSQEKWDVTAGYLAPELRNIMKYRQRAINHTLPRGKMNDDNYLFKKGVILAFEELQVGYPVSGRKNPTSKELLQNILAVGRQQGISLAASASTLTSIISESDENWLTKTNVFCLGRIISVGEKAIMSRFFGRDRMGRRKVEQLTRLGYDKKRLKKGKGPAEFARITRDKEIERFWPLQSRSEFRRERGL